MILKNQCLTFMIDDSMNEGIIGYINSRRFTLLNLYSNRYYVE